MDCQKFYEALWIHVIDAICIKGKKIMKRIAIILMKKEIRLHVLFTLLATARNHAHVFVECGPFSTRIDIFERLFPVFCAVFHVHT